MAYLPYYLNKVKFVPKRKITLTHNAINTSTLTKLYYKWEKKGRKRDKNTIVFVGRLSKGKKVDLLLNAFANIASKFPKAKLIIIGEGSQKKCLELKAKVLGLNAKVEFTGGIYDANRLANRLFQSSLFVLPALGGLGLNTAMAMGLPIICAHADGSEEDLIIDGYNGWYFNGSTNQLSDVIERALLNQKELKIMGSRSVTLIEKKFNLENMVKGYIHRINYLQTLKRHRFNNNVSKCVFV